MSLYCELVERQTAPASLLSTPHHVSPKKKVSSVVTLLPGPSGNASFKSGSVNRKKER
ncbi:hypothetical protein PPTG_23164 [Phytophthora nicotianae INRA-310]|uniref:Uncharacterized protein n=1 Tax=Phytophthora nicotianae (strain INRA-310) TaxID=761204 RepID=W2Q584_PHYN3|nr:hypothetical protein PPTG_23164 [Phytophthora nicotianae INRA-310]ETN07729.1 hypothetical protein PPTG_23164 [Phytophthora nicotianae INRA-310]